MRQCLVVVGMLMAGPNTWAASRPIVPESPAVRTNAKNSLVTPVEGESWLGHLGRSFGDTSMGKTWHLGPPPPVPGDIPPHTPPGLLVGCATQTTTLHGVDLYRLNCRGCHGEAGLGAPPEIDSIISPVRATSVQLVLERMKKLGGDMSRAQVMQLAQQAQAALLQRLHSGGKTMPPFPYLNEAETRSIMAYLRQLADISGAEKEQVAVTEPPVRVGELIVKSTCHICHSAAGPNPSPEQLLNGAIPPLEALTTRKDQSGLVQKVTEGAPILMGEPPMLSRGRMPVFHYLTSNEAADVYLYLTLYPPSELAILDPVATTSQPNGTLIGIDHAEPVPGAQAGSNKGWTEVPRLGSHARTQQVTLFLGLGLLVAALGAGGLAFTLWEFKRLSSINDHGSLADHDARVSPDMARPLVVVKGRPCRALSSGSTERGPGQFFTDEVGGLTRKNEKGGRQCHGARLG